MTKEEAAHIVAYLNACFPRETMEEPSVIVWVNEIEELHSFEAAKSAAKLAARNTDHLPTLNQFRGTYRQALDRINEGKLLDVPEPVASPPPPEAREMLERLKSNTVLRTI